MFAGVSVAEVPVKSDTPLITEFESVTVEPERTLLRPAPATMISGCDTPAFRASATAATVPLLSVTTAIGKILAPTGIALRPDTQVTEAHVDGAVVPLGKPYLTAPLSAYT